MVERIEGEGCRWRAGSSRGGVWEGECTIMMVGLALGVGLRSMGREVSWRIGKMWKGRCVVLVQRLSRGGYVDVVGSWMVHSREGCVGGNHWVPF